MGDFNSNNWDSTSRYLNQAHDYSWDLNLRGSSVGDYPSQPIAQDILISELSYEHRNIPPDFASIHESYGTNGLDPFEYPTGIAIATDYDGSVNNAFPMQVVDAASQDFESYPEGNLSFMQQADEVNIPSLPIGMNDPIQDLFQNTPNTQHTLVDQASPLRCTFPSCTTKTNFPSQSALKKHHEKHTRPYICTHCTKSFDTNASLQRHNQEVHGSESDAFFCSMTACKRNKRGFHRRYNLTEHARKKHGMRISNSMKRCRENNEKESQVPGNRISVDMYRNAEVVVEGDEQEIEVGCVEDGTALSGDMIARLQNLRAMRDELEEDIILLERALLVIDESAS